MREESEAAKRLIKARADAEETKVRAQAQAEERKLIGRAKAEEALAYNKTLTPLSVQLRGYDALKELGGSGANIMIGDWSKVPNFLFPQLTGGRAPSAPAPTP